jgi:hypothetical protein
MGVIRNASKDIEQYTDLDKLQIARVTFETCGVGFNERAMCGCRRLITTIPSDLPAGVRPFPGRFQRPAGDHRLSLVWWAMIPFMISGIIYAMRHRLRLSFRYCFSPQC